MTTVTRGDERRESPPPIETRASQPGAPSIMPVCPDFELKCGGS